MMIILVFSLFGLTVGEMITILVFASGIIGGAIHLNTRVENNKSSVDALEKATSLQIAAMKEATNTEVQTLKDSVDAQIKGVMEATNLRLNALETGRKENYDRISSMWKENNEIHEIIRKEYREGTNEIINLLNTIIRSGAGSIIKSKTKKSTQ